MEPNVFFTSTGEVIVWIFSCALVLFLGVDFLRSGIKKNSKSQEYRGMFDRGIDLWWGVSAIFGSTVGLIIVLLEWHLRTSNSYMLSHGAAILGMFSGVGGLLMAWAFIGNEIKKRRLGPLSKAANRKEKIFICARIAWGAGLIIASPVIFIMGLLSWSPWK